MFAPHAAFADYIMSQRGKPDRTPAEFRIGGQAMESVIAKLLQNFEQGKMNRRQLIQSLSLAAAAAAGIAPAARAAGKPLEALYVLLKGPRQWLQRRSSKLSALNRRWRNYYFNRTGS